MPSTSRQSFFITHPILHYQTIHNLERFKTESRQRSSCKLVRTRLVDHISTEHVHLREMVSDTSGVPTRVPVTDGMSEMDEVG